MFCQFDDGYINNKIYIHLQDKLLNYTDSPLPPNKHIQNNNSIEKKFSNVKKKITTAKE